MASFKPNVASIAVVWLTAAMSFAWQGSGHPGTASMTQAGGTADGQTNSQAPVAALPRDTVDTTFPDTKNYAVVQVAAGGNLQAAINNASCRPNGTVLRLASGARFAGNYTLPAKSCAPGQWIIIRTDTADSNLPGPTARISPKYSPVLAKILSANERAAILTAPQASYYWFMGLEIGVLSRVPLNYGVFAIGNGETIITSLPNHLIIDRCYLHGNATGNVRRGLAANGAYLAVVNSYFEDFHDAGQDTQAVWAYNSPGPIKIVNNFLSAAGENVMLGGADPSIPNLVDSDIEIRQNHFFKPLAWFRRSSAFAGSAWAVKNLLELKNAQRVLVEANVLENNWVASQGGVAVLLTPRNQSGHCPWCTVADVTFRYNIIRHANGGIGIAGADDEAGPSQPPQRIYIHDNLIYDINDAVYGPGEGAFLYQLLVTRNGAPHDIVIDHNTGFSSRVLAVLPDILTPQPVIKNFQFTNNIAAHARYGFGGSRGAGSVALKYYFSNWIFTNNLIEGIQGSGNLPSDYPRGNFFPKNWEAVGFQDSRNCPSPPGAGTPVDQNASICALSSSSPYLGRATDGRGVGADVGALVASTAGVL